MPFKHYNFRNALQPGLILAVQRAPGNKRQAGYTLWQVRYTTIISTDRLDALAALDAGYTQESPAHPGLA